MRGELERLDDAIATRRLIGVALMEAMGDESRSGVGASFQPVDLDLPPGWKLESCDYKGNLSRFGVYWLAVGPAEAMGEPRAHRDQAESDAWKLAGPTASTA
jgi:hypothetical protein